MRSPLAKIAIRSPSASGGAGRLGSVIAKQCCPQALAKRELKLGNIFETLSGAVTPEGVAAAIFHLLLLAILYAYSKMDARRASTSGRDYPQAGVTIINNAHCCCAPRRRRKTVRCRKVRSARRRSLRCQNEV